MTAIQKIIAREVLDSRGDPTVEAEVFAAGGAWGRAIVPSGASTGSAEAAAIRDESSTRFDGRGVLQAVAHVRGPIAGAILGSDVTDQLSIDAILRKLDDTPRKTRLGANAILAVSLAAAHAGAAARGVPLFRHLHHVFRQVDPTAAAPRMPQPMVNMISGGLHAGGNLDFQDFLIIPRGAAGLADAIEWSVRVYRRLGQLLSTSGYEGRLVGDEGGFGPRLASDAEACELIVRAIEAAGLRPADDVAIAIDVASTHFFRDGRYQMTAAGRQCSASQMIDDLASLAGRFPITSIEDPLAEDDWTGWREVTERLGKRLHIVGDDLFATNVERLRRGVELRAANSILIKVNQIGTLAETLETIRLARQSGYRCIVSARSGETEDTTIADLAVATAADGIKIGSIVRGERLAKYNQLLRIAERL